MVVKSHEKPGPASKVNQKVQPKKAPPPPEPEPVEEGPPVIYDEIETFVMKGEDGLSAEQAKDILGWEEEPEDGAFGFDFLFTDGFNKKIRCTKNLRNRPLAMPWCITLMQTILNKQFKLNGEPIIIGKYDNVISAQHRCIALVLAEQCRQGATLLGGDQSEHWQELWPEPITIDIVITRGIEEDSETTRTIDNVRPRTLMDVVYASGIFSGSSMSEQKLMSRMLDHAVRFLWHRTAADKYAFAPRRTTPEAMDFIERHPHVVDAVKHIFTEDKNGVLSSSNSPIKIGAGYAAALLYMMAASETDGDMYRHPELPRNDRSERHINLEMWDKATLFWSKLIKEMDPELSDRMKSSGEFYELRQALAALRNDMTGQDGTRDQKILVLIRAWNQWKSEGEIDESIQLEFSDPDDNGMRHCLNNDDLGGIDAGEEMKAPPTPPSVDAGEFNEEPGEGGEAADGSTEEGSETPDEEELFEEVQEEQTEEVEEVEEPADPVEAAIPALKPSQIKDRAAQVRADAEAKQAEKQRREAADRLKKKIEERKQQMQAGAERGASKLQVPARPVKR